MRLGNSFLARQWKTCRSWRTNVIRWLGCVGFFLQSVTGGTPVSGSHWLDLLAECRLLRRFLTYRYMHLSVMLLSVRPATFGKKCVAKSQKCEKAQETKEATTFKKKPQERKKHELGCGHTKDSWLTIVRALEKRRETNTLSCPFAADVSWSRLQLFTGWLLSCQNLWCILCCICSPRFHVIKLRNRIISFVLFSAVFSLHTWINAFAHKCLCFTQISRFLFWHFRVKMAGH